MKKGDRVRVRTGLWPPLWFAGYKGEVIEVREETESRMPISVKFSDFIKFGHGYILGNICGYRTEELILLEESNAARD